MVWPVKYIIIAAGLMPIVAMGQTDTLFCTVASQSYHFPEKCVSIIKSVYEKPNLNSLVLHDDENTGLEAAHDFCRQNGGSVTELQYGSVRNVSFGVGKSRFAFDPNQIFNNSGALKTLKLYSRFQPAAATVDIVRGLAIGMLGAYRPDSLGYIVTMHNNTDGRFSILSYLRDPKFTGVADSIFVNPSMDADDFVFVTEPSFYSYLKSKEVNVVLQSSSAKDGSLSVYAQTNRIPYVNIEVQDGHYDEHFRLTVLVASMFSSLKEKELYVAK